MDMLKTDDLQRLWALIQSAPIPALSLLVAVIGASATAGWLGRGQVAGGKIDGLEQRLALSDERVKFAEERVRDHKEAREAAERQLARLPAEVVAQLGPGFTGSLARLHETGRALEAAVVHAEMHVHEQSDGFDAVSVTAGPH